MLYTDKIILLSAMFIYKPIQILEFPYFLLCEHIDIIKQKGT